MSNKTNTRGFSPPRRLAPARLTVDEIKALSTLFKDLIDSSNLRWAIVAAGIAAICDIVHLC